MVSLNSLSLNKSFSELVYEEIFAMAIENCSNTVIA